MNAIIKVAILSVLTVALFNSPGAEARDFVSGPYLDQSGNMHWFNSRKAYRKATEHRDIDLRYRNYREKRTFVAASRSNRNNGRLFGRILPNFRSIRLSRSPLARGGLTRVWRPRGSSASGF